MAIKNTLVQQFVEVVSHWKGVSPNTHRFGGTEFKFGRVEVGHIHHNDSMVDIPFTVTIREVLVDENLALHHHLLTDSGWITFYINNDDDLQHAIWLMRLSYLQKASRRYSIDASTIDILQMSDTLKHAAFPKLSKTT